MTAISSSQNRAAVRPSVLSVWIIIVLTFASLMLGWIVKTIAESQTRSVQRAGLSASVPAGWSVRMGVAQEELIFSASDPFNPQLAFSVYFVPSVPGGQLSDSVTTRNLSNAKLYNSYKVLNQAPVKERGKDSYQITFSYVLPNGPGILPTVVKGMEYYFTEGEQVVVTSMVSPVAQFDRELPSFYRFVRSIKVSAGGVK